VSSAPKPTVGQNSSSTPSLASSSTNICRARAKRAASASPMMSTGLACGQCGGSSAFRRSSAAGDSPARRTPKRALSTTASAASTPGPPPLVMTASRECAVPTRSASLTRDCGRRPAANVCAAANN
jgi:hypothetical protein